MRDNFVDTLTSLMAEDERVILLTADLGFKIFDDLIERFPSRFINVGVAEQNMIGVATGLGLEGWTVFAYSIANFSTLRCLEQIRNDAAYHEVNVNIVASGGGFTYGSLGMSHHATEDLSIVRSLPGVTVVAPADGWESAEATRALSQRPGVGYLRIEKNVPINTRLAGEVFQIGKARVIRHGTDLTLVASGGIIAEALAAADALLQDGVTVRVISMHTLTPIDCAEIVKAAKDTKAILTIEENTISGGLGGAVAEVLAESGLGVRFKRIGMQNTYSAVVGDQEYLRNFYRLDAPAIRETALALLKN